jgi:hypothetical protein
VPYLELGGWIGRIWREQLEHVDHAAHGPCAHAIVFVLQQALVGQFLGDRHEGVAMRFLLVDRAQLIQERLEARQQVADADLLSGPSDQRLLELELLEAIFFLQLLLLFLLLLLLLLFDGFRCGGCASPTPRCHGAWLRVRLLLRLMRC